MTDASDSAPGKADARGSAGRTTFSRLRLADWVAFLAALALLFVTAADWYSTVGGEQAREFERGAPAIGEGAELADDAAAAAEGEERNAWQADGGIDRVILVALLGTALLGVYAAFMRAAGRRYEGALSPTAWAGLAAAITALLVVYRVLQEPGFDEVTTVQFGAPLALGVLGVLAFASAMSVRAEEEGRQFREVEPAA
jgi:drug/metabolite transporter (DMT)-like permease